MSPKTRFFPRTSRFSPSPTRPSITAMVLQMQGYQVGERCRSGGQHMKGLQGTEKP